MILKCEVVFDKCVLEEVRAGLTGSKFMTIFHGKNPAFQCFCTEPIDFPFELQNDCMCQHLLMYCKCSIMLMLILQSTN